MRRLNDRKGMSWIGGIIALVFVAIALVDFYYVLATTTFGAAGSIGYDLGLISGVALIAGAAIAAWRC